MNALAFSAACAVLLSALGCGGEGEATGGSGAGGAAGASSSGGGPAGVGGGGPGCADVTCTGPGEACMDGACVEDCRRSGAVPCAAPLACDVSDANGGRCVPPGSPCLTTSPPEPCGADKICGPGSACDGKGSCYPRVPCAAVQCDGATCYGTGCECTRTAACAAAPLGAPGEAGTLHDPAFLSGLIDVEFDPGCKAWGATLISGPDYLRSMAPDGEVQSIAGVTNLNMGEVAVLRRIAVPKSADLHSVLDAPGLDVSLGYICCSTCGCQLDSTPQGIARLDPVTLELPLVIPSKTFTEGSGPFGHHVVDTGPAGLSYGMDRTLYVGNVDENGDYYRLKLDGGERTLVTTFPGRVHASAPFDAVTMIVALEGGELRLLRVAGGASTPFASSEQPVTGLVRDFFDGTVYVARADGSVLALDESGSAKPFATTQDPARLAIAPDGFLYALEVPHPFHDHVPRLTRWELPKTR